MIFNTSPIRGQITTSTADATYTKAGSGVSAGRSMTRLSDVELLQFFFEEYGDEGACL